MTQFDTLPDDRTVAATPDYALGSVHAITEDGELLIGSASGSQFARAHSLESRRFDNGIRNSEHRGCHPRPRQQ